MKITSSLRVSFVALTFAGCYETSSLRVPVRSATSPVGCVELADQVFFEAGYAKISGTTGAMVYTPRRTAASASPSMASSGASDWGIGVWKPERASWSDAGGACEYELQAVSTDPTCAPVCPSPPMVFAADVAREPIGQTSCAIQCPMTPQPGAQFDQATREMAERLRTAGAATVSTTEATPASIK
jgi:hypothetical protein